MIDVKILKENPQAVRETARKRGIEIDVDLILELERKKREIRKEVESLRAKRNEISGAVKENLGDLGKAKEIKIRIKSLEEELKETELEFQKKFNFLPNMLMDDVPEGKKEEDNLLVKEVLKVKKFDFKIKDHIELGKMWDLIDIERAVKVSGSRFAYLKNEAALLEIALIRFAVDALVKENFIPVFPPIMVGQDAMKAMGYVDTKNDLKERYFLEQNKLFLVGTAEQSIGPMHKDEMFEEASLPKRYVAFSTCLREEAGSYGKDTKGIFRMHQFDKIEMFSFTRPDQSQNEHLYLLGLAEKMAKSLEVPYRVMKLCAGELSRPSASTYDIETWFPFQKRYRETNSVSNCTDFQARRLNIRYKEKYKNEFVHTLNGTALAIGRTIISILENHQQKNGKILIPKALRKYLGFKFIPSKL